MVKLSELLQERFKKKEKSKMNALAEKTAEGNLTVFSGIFGSGTLSEKDKDLILELLQKYASEENGNLIEDLKILTALTSEIKAIQNQAAILHGERIKKAQILLKKYKEGAFTAWLQASYGNRQTPYNFLQYYEFYLQIPKALHSQLESMPRQAIYTLASRLGSLEKKEALIRDYQGETKQQLLVKIRNTFPLSETDKRREDVGSNTLKVLRAVVSSFDSHKVKLTKRQKTQLTEMITHLSSLISVCETYES